MDENHLEEVTAEDLAYIWVRVQDTSGEPTTYKRFKRVTLADATDEEFDSWARSWVQVYGEGGWTTDERLAFCNYIQAESRRNLARLRPVVEADHDA